MFQSSSLSCKDIVRTSHHRVITLVRLKRNLLERLELLGLEEVDFALENDLGRRCGVDTAGFDGTALGTLVLSSSLLSNVLATVLIAYKAWYAVLDCDAK